MLQQREELEGEREREREKEREKERGRGRGRERGRESGEGARPIETTSVNTAAAWVKKDFLGYSWLLQEPETLFQAFRRVSAGAVLGQVPTAGFPPGHAY